MGEEHRLKIKNSNILNALVEHVEGNREMGTTQVSAALGLLRKVMPDLAQTTIGGDDELAPIRTQALERHIVDPKNPNS